MAITDDDVARIYGEAGIKILDIACSKLCLNRSQVIAVAETIRDMDGDKQAMNLQYLAEAIQYGGDYENAIQECLEAAEPATIVRIASIWAHGQVSGLLLAAVRGGQPC